MKTLQNSGFNAKQNEEREQARLSLQARLDEEKSRAERNRLGQFATPTFLARDILKLGINFLGEKRSIRFLDPAIGTGSFYSALLHSTYVRRIEVAKGYEIDNHYGTPACNFWSGAGLDIELNDFTKAIPPNDETERFNLVICNPPYVRHHHIPNDEKMLIQEKTRVACGVRINGLSGLYCYFLGLSHPWMQQNAIAGWLVPSEFMDVNYGKAIKQYLLDKVTLLRIHRFDPNDVQFNDALVSSAIIWFKNATQPANHTVEFTLGNSLLKPSLSRTVPVSVLRTEAKWTRFPALGVRKKTADYRLSDIFDIKRGVATGANKFFILSKEKIEAQELPLKFFRPILPSPRFLAVDEIRTKHDGMPIIDRQEFLLNCDLLEREIETSYPSLWRYLAQGKVNVSMRYLCQSRKAWYFQEKREPAPILCTYLGRTDTKTGRPFRFILNHSEAIATNVYLLLYPKAFLAEVISREPIVLRRIWQALNDLGSHLLLQEGRVYGGGLHKLEPKELANVNASNIFKLLPELPKQGQLELDAIIEFRERQQFGASGMSY